MMRLGNPTDWLPTDTRRLRWCLALVVLAGLCLFFAACNGTIESGFTPGTESLPPVGSGPESERANNDVQPLHTSPTAMADPEDPTPASTAAPSVAPTEALPPVVAQETNPAPAPAPTAVPAPSPAPTAEATPISAPTFVVLSLRLSEDQTPRSSPTAAWWSADAAWVSRYEVALGISMGNDDVVGWKDVGPATNYRIQDALDGVQISLAANQDYYLSIRALTDGGVVMGAARSQAWFVYAPYTFDVNRYPAITQHAPGSFWGTRHPDPRYAEWDESFEAYVAGSAAIDLYRNLGQRVLVGSDRVKILQTESNYPARPDVTRLGPAGDSASHSDTVASMLYDCEVSQSRQSYYRGCQVKSQKYAMTGTDLTARLAGFPPAPDNINEFRRALFGEMGAPQIMTMSHAHPTSVHREGDFATVHAQNLRLGDWIFSEFNILAISTQPGSYAGHENPTLGGNYYNSIVVGKKSYNYSYPAQSSVDNLNGPRNKPDIVVAASNLSEASSWSAPTLAAAASGFLALAYSEPLLAGATHMQTMKAIILAGAGKNHLCAESMIETAGYCRALPSRSEQWQWTNSETAPLDPIYGVGLFNYRNSFDILSAGRSIGSVESRDAGWDSQELAQGQTTSYPLTVTKTNDEFSLALTWNRDVDVDAEGVFSSRFADLQVELLDAGNRVLARSDDPGNNIEHIYVPGGLAIGEPYTIVVKAKSTANPIRYGLAWQARQSALRNYLWREE